MLEEIYSRDDDLTEDDYYDALFFLLGDAYPDLTDDEIEEMLEDLLDQVPESFAEGVLDTLGNVGKKIGAGALQFSADNPGLIKTATTATGAYIGGPIGAKIGSGVGTYITNPGQANPGQNPLLATGKTLAVMQNPQAQAAMARATLGVGNGTAPLTQNGKTNLIPVAMYLRALIAAAQEALRELDKLNVIPDASLSEVMPYAEDIDMQAEWLAEQLAK